MMRIGLDFDNTIINYDRVFYQVAVENGYLNKTTNVDATKTGIRDYFRSIDAEEKWTMLQGLVYGKEILKATPYSGVLKTIERLISLGNQVMIISHKTRTPFLGPQYDLHEAALEWLNVRLTGQDKKPLIPEVDIYFNETIEQKIDKISQKRCDIFLDDLPEVLMHPQFPVEAQKIYFNPNFDLLEGNVELKTIHSWQEFLKICNEI